MVVIYHSSSFGDFLSYWRCDGCLFIDISVFSANLQKSLDIEGLFFIKKMPKTHKKVYVDLPALSSKIF
jgi:hypothetical protein